MCVLCALRVVFDTWFFEVFLHETSLLLTHGTGAPCVFACQELALLGKPQ